ncbi:MAG: hypothetical protein LBV00_12210 [Propionibacteriaceae bacterium]|jgi:hypothetical protein|nr:hypothetical protein [Propionibacteriaceae bacterium]
MSPTDSFWPADSIGSEGKAEAPSSRSDHLYKAWTPDQPWVTVTVTDPDQLDVKVFGITYYPPEGFPPLTRAVFGLLMDHLYDRLRQTFTVELIETDGTHEIGTIDLRDNPQSAETVEALSVPPQSTEESPEPRHLEPESPTTPTPAAHMWLPASPTGDLPLAPGPAHPDSGGAGLNVPVQASGFIPGEEAAVALIVSGMVASATGEVQVQLPHQVIQSLPTGEIVLLGRSSGHFTIRQPLSEA